MNIKKFLALILSFAFVFSVATNVFAQSKGIPISDVNIQNVKVNKQDSNNFNLSFSIANGTGVQNGVKYSVRLMSQEQEQGKAPLLVDQKVYDEVLTLNEKSITNKDIIYTAPSSFSGKYSIYISLSNINGLMLGTASAGEYEIKGSSQGLEIATDTCTLSNSTLKGQSLSNGIAIKVGENISLNCTVVNNSNSSISATPVFETHYRSVYGETVNTIGGSQDAINISAGEKKNISVVLPKVDKPQSYETLFYLKSENDESNKVSARYTVLGAAATILNVSTDKDFYKKGETVKLYLVWVGSSDKVDSETVISDKDGNICGSINTQDIAISKQEINVDISKLCYSPVIGVSLKDKDGNILDQKTFNIETNSVSKLSAILGNIKGFIIVVILIVLIMLYVYMKRKGMHGPINSNPVLPAIFIAIAITFIPFSKTHAYCELNGPAGNQVNMCTTITSGTGPYNQGDTMHVFGELQNVSSTTQTLKMDAVTINNTSINLFPTPMYTNPIVLGPGGYIPGQDRTFVVNTPSSGTYNVTFSTQQQLGGSIEGSVVFTGLFRWGAVQYWGPAEHPPLTVHVNLHGVQYPTITSTGIHQPDTIFYIPANEIYGRRDGPSGSYCYPPSGCEIEGTSGFTYGVVSYVTGSGVNINNLIPDNGTYHVCRYAEDPYPDGDYFAIPQITTCNFSHPGSTQYR